MIIKIGLIDIRTGKDKQKVIVGNDKQTRQELREYLSELVFNSIKGSKEIITQKDGSIDVNELSMWDIKTLNSKILGTIPASPQRFNEFTDSMECPASRTARNTQTSKIVIDDLIKGRHKSVLSRVKSLKAHIKPEDTIKDKKSQGNGKRALNKGITVRGINGKK